MAIEYVKFGELLPSLDPATLVYEESRRLFAACMKHRAFEIVGLLRVEMASGQEPIEGIVVDCCDGTVPSRNSVGIRPRERLVLLYGPRLIIPYEVRPLRVGFPSTVHQNAVFIGEPLSLCLYFEDWSHVELTWTPAKHLWRILWWLRETSLKQLHRTDQPLERMYFVPKWCLVLPEDFSERSTNVNEVLVPSLPKGAGELSKVVRASFWDVSSPEASSPVPFDTLVVSVPPIVAGVIEHDPGRLGAMHEQFVQRGSNLLAPICEQLTLRMPAEVGMPIQSSVKGILLLLKIPVAATQGGPVVRTDVVGVIIEDVNIAQLGIACAVFMDGKDKKAYSNHILGDGKDVTLDKYSPCWDIVVGQVEVRFNYGPKEIRKASGIPIDNGNFNAVLAGVGSLGSAMADIWARETWGSWTLIDDDVFYPHNVVRHIGKDEHIGLSKVDIVASLMAANWPALPKPTAIPERANNVSNLDVSTAITNATLIVDASTTLALPRDLSLVEGTPRMASSFVTPSGRSAVLILEPENKSIRLIGLETQYYRAILENSWGETHLVGHLGQYWVGGGCRDLSGVLPQELIALHASTLARQIRLLTSKPDAQIRLWDVNEESGEVKAHSIQVREARTRQVGEWTVYWDMALEDKLSSMRAVQLPNETGGIILGYFDHKRRSVHIVDVMCAPLDSTSSEVEFVRGKDGVIEAVEKARTLTASIVEYIGEWHSHPPTVSTNPSLDDIGLLGYLAINMEAEGIPAVMLIVGDDDISIFLGQGAEV